MEVLTRDMKFADTLGDISKRNMYSLHYSQVKHFGKNTAIDMGLVRLLTSNDKDAHNLMGWLFNIEYR